MWKLIPLNKISTFIDIWCKVCKNVTVDHVGRNNVFNYSIIHAHAVCSREPSKPNDSLGMWKLKDLCLNTIKQQWVHGIFSKISLGRSGRYYAQLDKLHVQRLIYCNKWMGKAKTHCQAYHIGFRTFEIWTKVFVSFCNCSALKAADFKACKSAMERLKQL